DEKERAARRPPASLIGCLDSGREHGRFRTGLLARDANFKQSSSNVLDFDSVTDEPASGATVEGDGIRRAGSGNEALSGRGIVRNHQGESIETVNRVRNLNNHVVGRDRGFQDDLGTPAGASRSREGK